MIAESAPIDLQPYCSTDIHRYDFSKPFVQRGWRYATDACICVRVPTIEPDTVSESRLPKADEIFQGIHKSTFEPWSESPLLLTPGPCVVCSGHGVFPSERCQQCDGCRRVLLVRTREPRTCQVCEGKGWLGPVCFNCEGTEQPLLPYAQEVRGILVSPRYVRLIHTLPTPLLACPGWSDRMLYFRFPGGEGAVMTIGRRPDCTGAEGSSS